MIRQVRVKNFKCLRDVTVDLERFTVFVGANGSGKTSLLQALDLLCRTFRTQHGQSLDGEFLQHRSYGATDPIELSCLSGDGHFRYITHKQGSQQNSPRSTQASTSFDGTSFALSATPTELDWKQWKSAHGMLPNPVWLRLDPNALRNPGIWQSDPRQMSSNGHGLHSATASMNLEDPDLWQVLQDDLRRIVPSVRRLRHTPQNNLLFDMVNGKGLIAQQVSEGTLLTLGLLTAIHGVNKPGLLLLDDLDRALHPKAQRELIDLLRGVQATNPEIQIVGSTHSPYLLGRMEPNEVQVMSLRDNGSTACETLTHHPKFSQWKDEFHPGEMWSMFGEKWVAGAEAVAQ